MALEQLAWTTPNSDSLHGAHGPYLCFGFPASNASFSTEKPDFSCRQPHFLPVQAIKWPDELSSSPGAMMGPCSKLSHIKHFLSVFDPCVTVWDHIT